MASLLGGTHERLGGTHGGEANRIKRAIDLAIVATNDAPLADKIGRAIGAGVLAWNQFHILDFGLLFCSVRLDIKKGMRFPMPLSMSSEGINPRRHSAPALRPHRARMMIAQSTERIKSCIVSRTNRPGF